MKKVKKKSKSPQKMRKPKDLPATYRFVDKVRGELKSNIATLRLEMKAEFKKVDARFKLVDARFNQIDARFNQIDARFNQIDARFNQIDARFDQIDARFNQIDAQLKIMNANNSRMLALFEEQNSRNQASFEGAESVRKQQDDIRTRIEALENFQGDLSKKLKTN